MNDDVMRLSDLLSAYARYHAVTLPEAAFGLYELMDEAFLSYLGRFEELLPEQLFWVGRVGSSEPSPKGYVLDHQGLLKYFKGLCEPSTGADNQFISCFCHSDYSNTTVPASVVYFSRKAFIDWIQAASTKIPEFLSSKNLENNPGKPNEENIKAFQGKELVSIRGLARGLIEIIVELDRAHRGLSKKTNPEAILRAASQLDLNKKSSKWRAALADLANAAEVEDFRGNRRTLEKYVGD